MTTDESMPDMMDGVLAPTVPAGMRRTTLSGKRVWDVDPRIATGFSTEPGDAVVGVPLPILAHARSRYTLPLVLRALAWGSGGYDRKWLRRNRPDAVVLRLPVDVLRQELGVDPDIKPANLVRFVIEPAVREIQTLTDLIIDFEPVKAPSLKPGRGRVIAYDLLIGKIEARVIEEEHAPPPPARSAQITAFRPFRFGQPSNTPKPPADDDDEHIAF